MLTVARPAAQRLGTEPYLDTVESILTEGSGADHQRELLAQVGGDCATLQLALQRQAVESGIEDPEPLLAPAA